MVIFLLNLETLQKALEVSRLSQGLAVLLQGHSVSLAPKQRDLLVAMFIFREVRRRLSVERFLSLVEEEIQKAGMLV